MKRFAVFLVQVTLLVLATYSGNVFGNETTAVQAKPTGKTDSGSFTGIWLSSSDPDHLNVTELRQDHTFHTNRYSGIEVAGTIDGRWRETDNTIQWWYDAPPSAEEDINPLISVSMDRFSVREKSGKITDFFRKGATDPQASQFLPIALGTGWVLRDDAGEMAIRISVHENFAGKDCYRVDWVAEFVYQSEYWMITEEGVFAVGRRALDTTIQFAKPYLLLKHKLIPGDSWQADVSFEKFKDVLKFTVGAEEEIDTPAGRFRAIPVLMRGRALGYKRWYAKGIGLVREDSFLPGDFPLNEKKLSRRIEF